MRGQSDFRRRVFGALFLLGAIVMIVLGETVLQNRMSPHGFIAFYSLCFLFTCIAIATAFIDVAITRRRAREEQRKFFASTLQEIARRHKEARPENTDGERQS